MKPKYAKKQQKKKNRSRPKPYWQTTADMKRVHEKLDVKRVQIPRRVNQ